MILKRTNSSDNDFVLLVKQLDKYLTVVDGDDHEYYHQFNGIDSLNHVVIAYLNNEAVGCGALKPFDNNSIEIKRMFTLPETRGQGVASKILHELECWGKELGFEYSVLETGKRLPDAIGLYQKKGYVMTPNYGQYVGMENSVCFKKELFPTFS